MKRHMLAAVVLFCVGFLVSATSCGPETAQCEAYPACAEGYQEVEECPDDTQCEEASICGYTILCGETPPDNCAAYPVCPTGATEVATQSECPQDDVSCYEVSECGSTIWCWEESGSCDAMPTCGEGATEVASQSECPQDDVLCYEVSECDNTIWCWEPSSAECPDAADPEVHYVSDDPTVCAAADFLCDATQTTFNDECGCGCIGPEAADGDSCGGESGDTCGADEFCLYSKEEGAATCMENGVGTCTKRPEGDCLQVVDPVCGCDGQTYNNSCEAHTAGQDYYATGSCEL